MIPAATIVRRPGSVRRRQAPCAPPRPRRATRRDRRGSRCRRPHAPGATPAAAAGAGSARDPLPRGSARTSGARSRPDRGGRYTIVHLCPHPPRCARHPLPQCGRGAQPAGWVGEGQQRWPAPEWGAASPRSPRGSRPPRSRPGGAAPGSARGRRRTMRRARRRGRARRRTGRRSGPGPCPWVRRLPGIPAHSDG